MRAILNIGFQFFLGCILLMYITGNQSDQTVSDELNKISKNNHQFIVNQVQSTTQLIELAEIGEHYGNIITSSKASSLKDNQIAVLYHWIDLAEKNKVQLTPVKKLNDLVEKLPLHSGQFDEEWNRIVDQQTQSIVNTLHTYSSKRDKEINTTVVNVLSTLHPQVQIASENQMIAGN